MNLANSDPELQHFRTELVTRLRASRREPRCSSNDITTEMQAFEKRKAEFDRIAPQLAANVIVPRLIEVTSHFATSRVDRCPSGLGGCLWLGYSERFPVTAKVDVMVGHDAGFQNIVVRFEASIAPSFQPFEPHDKLLIGLADSHPLELATWLEGRLLEFIDAYMRIDRGLDDFEDEPVTDPVCGMRLLRSKSTSSVELRGHPYFFCTEACRQQFEQQPERYIVQRQSM